MGKEENSEGMGQLASGGAAAFEKYGRPSTPAGRVSPSGHSTDERHPQNETDEHQQRPALDLVAI